MTKNISSEISKGMNTTTSSTSSSMFLFIGFIIFLVVPKTYVLFPTIFFSGKNMKIMNLGGDGQGTGGVVTDVLRHTDDDAVDPHLERIKNQAGDEESDEEVLCSVFLDVDLLLSPPVYLFFIFMLGRRFCCG